MPLGDESQDKVHVLGPWHGRVCLGQSLLFLGQREHVVSCSHMRESGNIFPFFLQASLSKKLIKTQDVLWSFNDTACIVID